MPVPSYPAAHASGAPICGTLCSRSGFTLRSSQIFRTLASGPAALRPGVASLASSAPNAAASRVATDTPAPPMLSSVRACLTAGMAALRGTVALPS